MKTTLASVLLLLAVMISAALREDDKAKPSVDGDFLLKAYMQNLEAGKVNEFALQMVSDDKVKDFVVRLRAENKTLNDAFFGNAKRLQIAIPDSGDDTGIRARIDALAKGKGFDFDREFLKQVIDRQQQTLDLCQMQIDKGKDADLVALARDTIPKLKMHQEEAKKHLDRLKK
jgi:putative membrane protein